MAEPDYDALAAASGGTPNYDALAREAGGIAASSPMNFAIVNGKRQELEPNTLKTLVSHTAQQWNPIPQVQAIGKALIPQAAAEAMGAPDASSYGPLNAIRAAGAAQGAVFDKAKESYAKGDYATAARHFMDYLVPIIGPVMDQAADRTQRGEIAAGAGDALGLGLAMFGPQALRGAARASKDSAMMNRTADAAEQSANSRFAQSISPSGSSREIRTMGRQAEGVAGAVREGTTAITPTGLARQIGDHLDKASEALDAAYGAVPADTYPTRPLIDKLKAAKELLVRRGTGGTVIAQADRAKAIDHAMIQLMRLGPETNTAELAQLRNDWRIHAKDAFVPEVNPNATRLRASSRGWADAWSSLQEGLVERHPELKPLNADYRVWKTAADVVQALEDRELVRPTVGRSLMARGVGAGAGAALGGPMAGVGGAIVGPMVERFMAGEVAPAVKLAVARGLGNLAKSIRTGAPPAAIESMAKKIQALTPARLASPIGVPLAAEAQPEPTR